MGYHVPFAHRNTTGNQPPVYIGFESPHYANQRHYHQLHVSPRQPFNWSAFIGLMLALMSPFTLFLIAPIALLFSLRGMRRAPRALASFATLLSLGGTAILATIVFSIAVSHNAENAMHERAYQAGVLRTEQAETSVTIDAAASQLATYAEDHGGQLPAGVEGNVMTVQFSDAWNKELRYEVGQEQAIVRSAGPDGSFETADDLLTTVAGTPQKGIQFD